MCPHVRYGLSFRNLKELMAERDLNVDHVTNLAVGTALCTRAESPLPPRAAHDKPFLAGGRNVSSPGRPVDLFISSRGFRRCDD